VRALSEAVERWRDGAADAVAFDDDVDRCRATFAAIARVREADVAIGAAVSTLTGLIAAGLRPGARVLLARDEFSSVASPFLALRDHGRIELELVPFEELPGAVHPGLDLVAWSSVRSQDGLVSDVEAVAAAAERHGVATCLDATHSMGWLALDHARLDYVAAAAYKWLLCPKGVAFLVVGERRRDALPPVTAGWYAGADRWDDLYGEPPQRAAGARRFDAAPAWLTWVAAAPALELLAGIGPEAIGAHDLALAARLREALGMPAGGSPIVAVERPRAVERFAAAGLRAAGRDGRLRVGLHLYNDEADVDAAIAALTG
jgi:selenocysteine lyase/cysteine desulfurase